MDPLARHTDPATSHDAGEAIRPKLPRQHTLLLSEMVRFGDRPRTASEIEQAAEVHVCPHKRLPEMERLGLVVRWLPRRCTVTGVRATTWRMKR